MPFFAPRGASMPHFSTLLSDSGDTPAAVARHLGISVRTLQRYASSGHAPRPVMLALWVESRWGRAAVSTQLQNEAAHYFATTKMAQRQIDALTAQIHALERERAVGEGLPANSPFFTPGALSRSAGSTRP